MAGDSNALNALAATKDGFLRHVRDRVPALGLAILASNPDHYTRLLPLLDDDDEEVRNNTSTVMRHAFDMLPSQADELVQTFIASKAFPDNLGGLAFALHHPTGLLPSAALEACEYIVGRAGTDLADIRTRHAAHGRYVVTAVLRLYRQSPPSVRSHCLDIIDALSRADVLVFTRHWKVNADLIAARLLWLTP
ncbi:hypothetical protein [Streptomyces hydrogenans]